MSSGDVASVITPPARRPVTVLLETPHRKPQHPQLSAVHRLAPQAKLVGLVAIVISVAATPGLTVWPYFAQAVVIGAVCAVSRVPARQVARGLAIEAPFVLFALMMPLFATGERVSIGPLGLSVPGLWGAWAMLAKSTLSVWAAVILAATTSRSAFVTGLRRLRLPALLVEILSFMVRYLDVIADQWRRMSIARSSRGFRPRSPHAWPALSGAIGTGFIRAYERGERVHLAMLSRGYAGTLPDELETVSQVRWQGWVGIAVPVLASFAVTLIAWVAR